MSPVGSEMIAGTARSSRVSTRNRLVGRLSARRPPVAEGRDWNESSKERNHMGISFAMVVCSRLQWERQRIRRADRAPGRCRAGGGLLGGKDPPAAFVHESILNSSFSALHSSLMFIAIAMCDEHSHNEE